VLLINPETIFAKRNRISDEKHACNWLNEKIRMNKKKIRRIEKKRKERTRGRKKRHKQSDASF
jgi:hypothetical protein